MDAWIGTIARFAACSRRRRFTNVSAAARAALEIEEFHARSSDNLQNSPKYTIKSAHRDILQRDCIGNDRRNRPKEIRGQIARIVKFVMGNAADEIL